MKIARLINPDTNRIYQESVARFEKLPQNEQIILYILSMSSKPIGAGKFNKIISALARRVLLPTVAKDYRLTPERKSVLINQKMLVQTKDGMSISAYLTHHLEIDVHDSNWLTSLYYPDAHQMISDIIEDGLDGSSRYFRMSNQQNAVTQVKADFTRRDFEKLVSHFTFNKNPQIIDIEQNQILVELFFIPYDLDTILQLSDMLQYQLFATLFALNLASGQNIDYQIALTRELSERNPQNTLLSLLLAEMLLYQSDLKGAYSLLKSLPTSAYQQHVLGAYRFFNQDNVASIDAFEKALSLKQKYGRRKKPYIAGFFGLFYRLALIQYANQRDITAYQIALTECNHEIADRKAPEYCFVLAQLCFNMTRQLESGVSQGSEYRNIFIDAEVHFAVHNLSFLLPLLTSRWLTNQTLENSEQNLSILQANFSKSGLFVFSKICDQLVDEVTANSIDKTKSRTLTEATSEIHYPSLFKPLEPWQNALEKLASFNKPVKGEDLSAKVEQERRLIWELHVSTYYYQITAREQKVTKAGWSKGRLVSLKRLHEEHELMSFLTESDHRLCNAIHAEQSFDYYGKTEYVLEGISALLAAVEIDNLYLADRLDVPISLVQKEPELVISKLGDEYCLTITDSDEVLQGASFEHGQYDFRPKDFSVKKLSDDEYALVVFNHEHRQVAQILGEGGLMVPIHAKQNMIASVNAIAPFLNIHSDIEELDTGLARIECDQRLVINIQPYQAPHAMPSVKPSQQGLEFQCTVMPFGEDGPQFIPGVGSVNITTHLDGERIATQRDLIREQQQLDQLDKYCPAFLNMMDDRLICEDMETALETLEQLEYAQKQSDLTLLLRWPKGKRFALTTPLTSEKLQLAMTKTNEWFDVTGQAIIDGEEVIELKKLLALMSTSHGRYIELDEQRILALTDDVRNKLELLSQVTDEGKFHPLASPRVDQATQGMRMKTLDAWEKQTQKMHQANEIKPEIPSTFKAELRDYQRTGFDWAMRLAHWGAGACLSDDMGLGKTLQALAVLVARAKDGPSLVLAPTSVCFNWQQEAYTFAPTLNMHMYANAVTAEARQEKLNNLGAMDCLIVSYGLLQRDIEKLASIQWANIVFDEAQALKNPLAKRTKAAYQLYADFKMITTGTPIENDLTELWSLFRLINPGLLGNLARFNRDIIQPIAKAKEDRLAARKASQRLKALIQPFVLRRLKQQVLKELPERTEINLYVELSKDERVLYEAIRQTAIEKVTQSEKFSNAGEQRIQILAELVKIRQACCHPKLVLPSTEVSSAKLELLDKTLSELLLNGHKVLIFSQFVTYLSLIKDFIEQKGIRYQYLDGSTPAKARQVSVEAFQSGEGDVFLISLKAGGFGLNLTAADYVIHMDPWWNPAVEDQASDRAHRFGQTRPVTIYRMITKDTIEEKISALHQQKRELADRILAGNDEVKPLSVEDMLVLLKDTF